MRYDDINNCTNEGKPVIQLMNVTKKYPNGHTALHQVSLHITPGEMVFLEGHSGAGKSTLLKLIALIERPTRGNIKVGGHQLNEITTHQIPYYRRRLGYITQHPKLLNTYSVFENVAIPLVVAGYSSGEIQRRSRAALERVGLAEKERYTPLMLSEGEQQRLGIARAVVHKPRLLLADEPTGNLDPELALEIMRLFERFHQVGVTVVIASHDRALLNQFPYRRIHLVEGKVAEPQRQLHEEAVV